jgi:hypothetical protein
MEGSATFLTDAGDAVAAGPAASALEKKDNDDLNLDELAKISSLSRADQVKLKAIMMRDDDTLLQNTMYGGSVESEEASRLKTIDEQLRRVLPSSEWDAKVAPTRLSIADIVQASDDGREGQKRKRLNATRAERVEARLKELRRQRTEGTCAPCRAGKADHRGHHRCEEPPSCIFSEIP